MDARLLRAVAGVGGAAGARARGRPLAAQRGGTAGTGWRRVAGGAAAGVRGRARRDPAALPALRAAARASSRCCGRRSPGSSSTGPGSGSLLNTGSGTYSMVHSWVSTDPALLIGGFAAALLTVASRRLRPFGVHPAAPGGRAHPRRLPAVLLRHGGGAVRRRVHRGQRRRALGEGGPVPGAARGGGRARPAGRTVRALPRPGRGRAGRADVRRATSCRSGSATSTPTRACTATSRTWRRPRGRSATSPRATSSWSTTTCGWT